MSSEQLRYGTYREFADSHLVRIAALGYNVLQLMAIGDHAYYASFGYQVTNFFAPAHRSGKPNDLKVRIAPFPNPGTRCLMPLFACTTTVTFTAVLATAHTSHVHCYLPLARLQYW